MKKVITGATLSLTGAILFLSVFVAASNMQILDGWNLEYGQFWKGMIEAKLIPVLVLSIIVMCVGLAVMLLGNKNKPE